MPHIKSKRILFVVSAFACFVILQVFLFALLYFKCLCLLCEVLSV